jgi:hypothetical protein
LAQGALARGAGLSLPGLPKAMIGIALTGNFIFKGLHHRASLDPGRDKPCPCSFT